MKIPDSRGFGNVTPTASRTPTVNTDGGLSNATENLANGVQRLANTAIQIDVDAARQQATEAEKARERDEKIKTVTAHATIQNGLADTFDAVSARLNRGETDQLGAMAEWKEAQQKVIEDNTKDLPEGVKPVVQAGVIGLSGQLTNKLTDVFRANDSKVASAGRIGYSEQMERFAATDPNLAIKQMHQYLDNDEFLNPEERVKQKQGFAEKVRYTQAYGLIANSRDSVGALEAVRRRLNSDEFLDVDPQRRAALDSSVNTRISTLTARAAAQAEASARRAQAEFTSFATFMDSGRPPSAEYAVQTVSKFKGTPYESTVMAMLKDGSETAGFSSKSVTEQRNILMQESSRLNTAGSDPTANKRYQKMQSIHDATMADIKADPLTASVDRNVNATLQPISFDINTLPQQLAARRVAADTASAWSGKPVAPLTRPEAEQFADMIAPLGAKEKAALLKTVSGTIGPRGMQALSGLIGDKNGEISIAAGLSSLNTTEGRNVAAIYLDGKQVLKDGRAKLDSAKETGTRAQIYQTLQGVYPTQKALDQAADVAMSIYASKKAAGDDNLNTAIKLATGGVVEYNGAKIALPYGRTQQDITDSVKAVTPAALSTQSSAFRVGSAALTPEALAKQLPNLPLQSVGNGTYAVRVAGLPVLKEDGTPLILNFGGSDVR